MRERKNRRPSQAGGLDSQLIYKMEGDLVFFFIDGSEKSII